MQQIAAFAPPKGKIRPTPPTAKQSGVALPIKKFAAAYGVHPSTVWRAVHDGLAFIVIGKRKVILPPVAQKAVISKPANLQRRLPVEQHDALVAGWALFPRD